MTLPLHQFLSLVWILDSEYLLVILVNSDLSLLPYSLPILASCQQFSILLQQPQQMQFPSTKKGKQIEHTPFKQVKGSITESTSHHSYISFKTPSREHHTAQEKDSRETHTKRDKYLNVISKPAIKISHPPEVPLGKQKKVQSFGSLEGFCACIAKSQEGNYAKIKETRTARQDLSSLLTSKVESKGQSHQITPINSLLNLLEQ